MMRYAKYAALLLALVFCLGLFSACGGNKEEGGAESGASLPVPQTHTGESLPGQDSQTGTKTTQSRTESEPAAPGTEAGTPGTEAPEGETGESGSGETRQPEAPSPSQGRADEPAPTQPAPTQPQLPTEDETDEDIPFSEYDETDEDMP